MNGTPLGTATGTRRWFSVAALLLGLLVITLPMALASTRIDLQSKLSRAVDLLTADPADLSSALRNVFFQPVLVAIFSGLAIFASTSAFMAGRYPVHGDDALGDPVPEYRLYDWRLLRWRSIMPAMAVTTVLVLIIAAAGVSLVVQWATSISSLPGPAAGTLVVYNYPGAMWTGIIHAAVVSLLIGLPWVFLGRARQAAMREFGWLLHVQLAALLALVGMMLFITTGYSY